MKRTLLALFVAAAALFSCGDNTPELEPVDYVNPRIGNISHMLVPTFPLTHLPFGMVRMMPSHWDFLRNRTAGTPLNIPSHRNGDMHLVKPFCGDTTGYNPTMQYTYDQELCKPYYYKVRYDEYDIVTEFAPSYQAASLRFTFEAEGNRYVAISGSPKSEFIIEGNTLTGKDAFRSITHYFSMTFDQPIKGYSFKSAEKNSTILIEFDHNEDVITSSYGVSYIDCEQAAKNRASDIADMTLDEVAATAREIWNKELSKIELTGGTYDQKVTFYTALYRTCERMVSISEDGRYFSGYDRQIHDDEGINFWVDDWIWDTYQAMHPLHFIINPEIESQRLKSYIRMYEQSGLMPTFPTVYGDVHGMNGNHSSAIFIDGYRKGIDFDLQKAYEGLSHSVTTETMMPWRRMDRGALDDYYFEHGFFPGLREGEKETDPTVHHWEKRQSVAITQAAAFDDWAISEMAKELGDREGQESFGARAHNYRNLFNPETGFFHPKDKDGVFIEPFDYIFSGGLGLRDYYDENNGWTYRWNVRHDISDLISLMGGNEQFNKNLDDTYEATYTMARWDFNATQPDATGMVGQFVMGNEPSFHIPYLYNYSGAPWKTQKRIRMLLEAWFRNDLMGTCGDEDGGGMSAFYVFSAMGFYPVSPGIPAYNIGSPLFDKSAINLADGGQFTITAHNNSHDNKYVVAAKINGKTLDGPWFWHKEIVAGGELELWMSDRPNKSWGSSPECAPPSQY